jgi:hypothetical protein
MNTTLTNDSRFEKIRKLPSQSRLPATGSRAGTGPQSEKIGHIARPNSDSKIPQINSFVSANNTLAQRTLYITCPVNTSATVWPFASGTNPTSDPAYLGGRDIQFYALDSTRTAGIKTGVIYVTTFDPLPAEGSCFNRFVLDIVLGLQNFTTAGVERILVDTSVSRSLHVSMPSRLETDVLTFVE